MKYALDAIFSFSYKPLKMMTLVGLFISSLGFALACFFILRRLTGIEVAQTGFTTLVTLVLFLGGVQLIAIGLLGEYLARIYDEVKQRPLYIVKRGHGTGAPPAKD
jgi:dolichol-phosphate mannosyltransferase